MMQPTEVHSEVISSLRPAPPANEAPRGISPKILMVHLRNTMPWFFETPPFLNKNQRHFELLKSIEKRDAAGEEIELSHSAYFEMCLAAHHTSVCTFVPTDVDNQIRHHLWHPSLPLEVREAMARTVEESLTWDCRAVSKRFILSPLDGTVFSYMSGEWFSTVVGSYYALKRRAPERAKEILEQIVHQIKYEQAVLAELIKQGRGLDLLRAATMVAHNLGDLDRVIDMWEIDSEDPIRDYYGLGDSPKKEWRVLKMGGDLNRELMADENHRHFPLRSPKSLRRHFDLLLPIGPFLDDWGKTICLHPTQTKEEVAEIAEALIQGWERLEPVGYARALSGIENHFPGGLSQLCQYLPSRAAKQLKTGALRQAIAMPQKRFEDQWHHAALKRVKL